MSDKDYGYDEEYENEEYEFEQTRDDQNKVKMGIAGGMAGAIIAGLKWGHKMYQGHKEQMEREELNAKRQALEADLNGYEDKFFSFRYEDKKANLRRQIKEIDKKLQG